MSTVDYKSLDEAFNYDDTSICLAEIHGLVCGFICAGSRVDGKSWLEPILSTFSKQPERLQIQKKILLDLYRIASEKLQSFEFDFELMLPEDDMSLSARAEALCLWCQGFIIALNRCGIEAKTIDEPQSKEAVEHIIEISRLDYDAVSISEQDEAAFNEVAEYVRMAVLLVHSELCLNYTDAETDGSKLH